MIELKENLKQTIKKLDDELLLFIIQNDGYSAQERIYSRNNMIKQRLIENFMASRFVTYGMHWTTCEKAVKFYQIARPMLTTMEKRFMQYVETIFIDKEKARLNRA